MRSRMASAAALIGIVALGGTSVAASSANAAFGPVPGALACRAVSAMRTRPRAPSSTSSRSREHESRSRRTTRPLRTPNPHGQTERVSRPPLTTRGGDTGLQGRRDGAGAERQWRRGLPDFIRAGLRPSISAKPNGADSRGDRTVDELSRSSGCRVALIGHSRGATSLAGSSRGVRIRSLTRPRRSRPPGRVRRQRAHPARRQRRAARRSCQRTGAARDLPLRSLRLPVQPRLRARLPL
jgi:hypothetical protein